MLLFCGTRTLCSKNEETKVCVFFCVINSGKVEKWLTPILKGHVATCFGALFHKILVVIPWVYYVSLISPLSSTSDLEFVCQISHFFDLRISDTCSTCCVLHISCFFLFFLWHSMPGFSKRSPYSQRAAASGCSTCRESAAHFGTWDAHGTTWINLKNPWRNRAVRTRPGYVNS